MPKALLSREPCLVSLMKPGGNPEWLIIIHHTSIYYFWIGNLVLLSFRWTKRFYFFLFRLILPQEWLLKECAMPRYFLFKKICFLCLPPNFIKSCDVNNLQRLVKRARCFFFLASVCVLASQTFGLLHFSPFFSSD